MDTTQTSTLASARKISSSTWRKSDTMWMLGLYGTAIGAGVLFCPSRRYWWPATTDCYGYHCFPNDLLRSPWPVPIRVIR